MRGILLAPLACAVLASCAPSSRAVAKALEQAWTDHPEEMGVAAGLIDKQAASGTGAAIAMAARSGRTVADVYTHGLGGRIIGSVIAGGSSLVRASGVGATADIDDRLQRALATDWTVSDLKILDARESAEARVYLVRYSLFANTTQGRSMIFGGKTQMVKLVKDGATWVVDTSGA